jgi:hypothetical protein
VTEVKLPSKGAEPGEDGGVVAEVDNRRPPSSNQTASNANRASPKANRDALISRTPPPGFALELLDGDRRVSLDGQGRAAGLEGLPAKWRRAVESALLARRVDRPATLEALGAQTETLLGSPNEDDRLNIIGPTGTVIESDRPSFRWRALRGEWSYTVTVFDSNYNRVAQSDRLSTTEWSPSQSLQRGATYVWKVTAMRDGEEIVAPAPPVPEARFRVLEQASAVELARARRLYPESHLMLGVLYARAGMAAEAEREFQALVESNPNSSVARSLLRSVREWRRSR